MKFLKYLLFSLSFSGGVKASAPVIPSFVNNLEIIANTPEEFIQKMRVQEELWLSGAHESPSIEFLKNCAIYQGNLVKQALLILMADVEDSLAYWREEKKRYAIFYHICKSPSKWQNGKSQKEELQEYFAGLESAKDQLATFLGQLDYSCEAIQVAGEDTIFETIKDFVVQLGKTLQSNAFVITRAIVNEADVLSVLISNMHALELYKTNFTQSIVSFKKPEHFERYWLRYAGLGLTAAALYWYRAQIPDVPTIKKFFNNSFNEYVKAPLQSIRDTILGSDAEKKELAERHAIDKAAAVQVLNREVKHNFPGVDHLGSEVMEQVKSIPGLGRLVSNPYKSKIEEAQKLAEQLPKLNYNLDEKKDYSTAELLKWLAQKDADLDQLLSQQDPKNVAAFGQANLDLLSGIVKCRAKLEAVDPLKKYQDNKLTAALSSAAPIGLGLYGAGKAVKHSYAIAREESYKPLRYTLNQIEQLLNHNPEGAARMAFKDQGLMLYNLHILKQQLDVVPREYRQRFEQDIAEIEEPQLTIAQKLNIVQRMYRTYNFLLPQCW